MKFDPVILLATVAFCLIIISPIFRKDPTISTRFRSRERRKVLFGQLTIIALLIATSATLVWPISGMHSLLQGVLLCLLVLVPAFVFNLLVSLHYRSAYPEAMATTESGTEAWFAPGEGFFTDAAKDGEKKPTNVDKPEGFSFKSAVNAPIDFGTDSMSVIHLTAKPHTSDELDTNEVFNTPDRQKKAARSTKPLGDEAALSGIPRHYSDAEKNSEPAVDEQLERVLQLVQSQDLGVQNTIALPADKQSDLPVMSKSLRPQFNALVSAATNTANLESMARSEMSGLVTSLTIDNGRLQKLVIAQHAVIESQRESNNLSREVSRDAIKIMCDAQSDQKIAEKIARCEKIERQRIQTEYHKVTSVLETAMSIISVNRETSFTSDGA
jgi:hypothetical protein